MPKKNGMKVSVSRRNILRKSTVGVGASITGLSQPVFAKRATTPGERNRFGQLPEVRAILDELEQDALPGLGKFDTTEAVVDSSRIVLTEVEFRYGTLKIVKLGEQTDAAFSFDQSHPSGGRGNAYGRRPPEKYRNIPEGSEGWLLVDENRTVFRRTATEEEQEAALTEVSVKENEETIIYGESDTNGLVVFVFEEPSGEKFKAKQYVVRSKTAAGSSSVISSEKTSLQGAELMAHSSDVSHGDDISTQWFHSIIPDPRDTAGDTIDGITAAASNCGDEVLDCVGTLVANQAVCTFCAPVCVSVLTGLGAIVCFGCIFGSCSHVITGVNCVRPGGALDCLDSHNHI